MINFSQGARLFGLALFVRSQFNTGSGFVAGILIFSPELNKNINKERRTAVYGMML
jgi:hypothetical protein